MRAVIQRVSKASVSIKGEIYSQINHGIVVLLGIKVGDTQKDIDFIAEKLVGLRIFSDDNEKLNLSIKDIDGELLIISNFTVYGETKKGRRPSYTLSAKPELAEDIYQKFINKIMADYPKCKTGIFRADMEVMLVNDGPVTLIIDSDN